VAEPVIISLNDLFLNTRSFLPLRNKVCGAHVREIEESKITSVLNECLRNFPHIGVLKKEQKTCLVNLAYGKDVFAILPTGFDCNPFFEIWICESLSARINYSTSCKNTNELGPA